MLIGCGRHVSPIVPTLADAAWAHFERGNITPRDFKLVDAIARCAAAAPESPNAVALDASPKRHAVNPSSESNASAASAALVSRLANALAELQPQATEEASLTQQALIAEWFDLIGLWTLSDNTLQPGLAACLRPAVPHLLTALWNATRHEPPPSALETQQGAIALKRAFHLLMVAIPPSPVGSTLHSALATSNNNGSTDQHPPAAQLLASILVGLSSWFPSWILAEAVSALWSLRSSSEESFTLWLTLALSSENVPRPGLSSDQKNEMVKRLTSEAKTKAAFKANLKQVTGGKKKGTSGSAPNAVANGATQTPIIPSPPPSPPGVEEEEEAPAPPPAPPLLEEPLDSREPLGTQTSVGIISTPAELDSLTSYGVVDLSLDEQPPSSGGGAPAPRRL